jgi:hypothetical protein
LQIEKKTTPEDKSTSNLTIPMAARIYAEGRREGNFLLKISRRNKKGKREKYPASGIHTKAS